jgi:hypothetical protein
VENLTTVGGADGEIQFENTAYSSAKNVEQPRRCLAYGSWWDSFVSNILGRHGWLDLYGPRHELRCQRKRLHRQHCELDRKGLASRRRHDTPGAMPDSIYLTSKPAFLRRTRGLGLILRQGRSTRFLPKRDTMPECQTP